MGNRQRIYKYVLGLKLPFRVSDIIIWANRNNISDEDGIVEQIVDDMKDKGLIKYSEIERNVWAYNTVY